MACQQANRETLHAYTPVEGNNQRKATHRQDNPHMTTTPHETTENAPLPSQDAVLPGVWAVYEVDLEVHVWSVWLTREQADREASTWAGRNLRVGFIEFGVPVQSLRYDR